MANILDEAGNPVLDEAGGNIGDEVTAAVTRVNSASITGNATSSPATITIPAGTGIQAGDLIVIATDSKGVASPAVTVKDSVNGVNFTQLLQETASSSANRYLTGFYYKTPQAIADLSTITVTSAGATQAGGAVDIFRGCSGSIDMTAAGQANASSTSQPAPALGANATSGSLVITMLVTNAATLTAGSPFTTGSHDTACCAAIGYTLSASGSGTYASTWTTSAASTGATQTVSLAAGGPVTHAGTAALSGTGTLGAGTAGYSATYAATYPAAAGNVAYQSGTLSGTGTLSATGTGRAGVQLSGTGALAASRAVTWRTAAALDGTGTMTGGRAGGRLTGTGTLGISGVRLGYPLALSGSGTMTVLKVLGGLVSATSLATVSSAYPNSSQVAVAAPGSANWMYLGSLGVVTSLTYSFTCPGGADHMTCTVMVPAAYRTQAFNPGSQVRITRGGHVVWTGKLDEPVPTAQGWNLSAVGDGNRGTDFLAVYSSAWPSGQPDEPVNNAIERGLPWANPGVGSPSGAWYGQQVDSAGQTITSLLNLICTRGGLTWYVNSQPGGIPGTDLNVFPLPTTVNRLLVCTTPVPRTLGGDINTIWIRYQSGGDTGTSGSSAVATYGLTSVQNAQSVAMHGVIETFIDLSDVGTISAGAAQAAGNAVLQIYQRASFAGPFQASYGALMNPGGVPIDPGTDQAGTVCRLILTDYAYGGEIVPDPITFITGGYTWDDTTQVASLVPYQSVDQSLSGLLGLENTALKAVVGG